MPLHDLKDLGEALEKVRRVRKDLPEGDARQAIDGSIVRLVEHVEHIVGGDERLAKRTEAEREAIKAIPQGKKLQLLRIEGHLERVVQLILDGAEAASAWKTVLGL